MTSRRATTLPAKRVKLESRSPSRSPSIVEISPPAGQYEASKKGDEVVDEEHCSICLQSFADRTVIPACSHEFCFECLLIWTEQSRKCPLCSQPIGDYLIHRIRSKYDYQKHFLAPLRTSTRPQSAAAAAQRDARRRARTRREREWVRRQREAHEEADELERAVEKRRWVYRHHLYAKHVASNPYTRYRPLPTPAQFSASQDLISRATVFLRRELRVWVGLDVEFLTTFTLSLMKSLDIRSEPAVRLLAEFLDMDSGGERVKAEHFAHELYSYLRSPYRDLARYDEVVQYDVPPDLPPPSVPQRSRRWRSRSRSASNSRSQSPASSSPQRALRRPRSPLPLSPRSNGRLHELSAPSSPRPPNIYTSRSRREESWSPEPSYRTGRRRSRDNEDVGRSSLRSGSANTSTIVRRKEREPSPGRTQARSEGKGHLIDSGGEGLAVRGESTRRIAANGSRAQEGQGPEHHYVDAEEQHNSASTIRTRSSRSSGRRTSPTLNRNSEQNGTAPSADGDARDKQSDPACPPASSGEDIRRKASARVRRRNLLESVQAHLSIRPSLHHGSTNPGTLASPAIPSCGAGGAAQRNEDLNLSRECRPSLLERMSDTVLALPAGKTVRDSVDESVGQSQSGDMVHSALSAPSSLQTSPTAIQAEGRRSVEDGQTVGPASTRAEEATPPVTSGFRELLLSKLAAEKRKHLLSAPATLDENSRRASKSIMLDRGSSDSIEALEGGTVDGQPYDSAERAAEREAKLRSQARLRVRLAAAKKAAAHSTEGGSTTLDVSETHGVDNGKEA